MAREVEYEPTLRSDVAERLRRWHDENLRAGKRAETQHMTHLGWHFLVPPEVYPPRPRALADLVLHEARPGERVLDMGCGSGVNAIAAASRGAHVTAVDINPEAAECTQENAALNGLGDRIDARQSDLFENVEGSFDLIVFDPPYKWFAAHDLYEQGSTDENYATLTAFIQAAKRHLAADGRILLAFSNLGDIEYLWSLLREHGYRAEEVRRTDLMRDGFLVSYFAYRVTADERMGTKCQ